MASSHLFHLSQQKPQNKTQGGMRLVAAKHNFPTLKGMSFYKLTLFPKGIREPHWHANADELGYCLKGEALVTFYGTGNLREVFLVKAGEAFFIPSGYLHQIVNTGAEESELILQFSSDEPEDFALSSTFGMFSDAVLGNTWGVTKSVFAEMQRSTKELFATLQEMPVCIPENARYANPYRFDLQNSSPLIVNEGGCAKVARQDGWPILRCQALYFLLLTGTGMREPHWHPETAELGFVRTGRGRMSIMSPDRSVDTYEMSAGDIYFIPKGYPHHIENLENEEELELLIFFDKAMPEDIGFTASVKSSTDEVLASVLSVLPSFFKSLPTYHEDLFIVKKVNQPD